MAKESQEKIIDATDQIKIPGPDIYIDGEPFLGDQEDEPKKKLSQEELREIYKVAVPLNSL